MDTARDEIINKIRLAISSRNNSVSCKVDTNSPVYNKSDLPVLEEFILEFEKVSGEIYTSEQPNKLALSLKTLLNKRGITKLFCIDINLQKFLNSAEIPYLSERDDFEDMEVGVTGCEYLIADTGSIIISTKSHSGRKINVFPPIHIVYAELSQLVENLEQGIKRITEKYGNDIPSLVSTITGPSRTADIEKTLVMGAHGPKELIILLNLENK